MGVAHSGVFGLVAQAAFPCTARPPALIRPAPPPPSPGGAAGGRTRLLFRDNLSSVPPRRSKSWTASCCPRSQVKRERQRLTR